MSEESITLLLQKVDQLEKSLSQVASQVAEIRQLTGPFSATFPDGSMLTQTIHGLKYFVDPDDLVIAPQMIVYRQWEADLSDLFRRLCKPDTILVDVGANFGYFTVLGANLIGNSGSGQVIAYEPNPKLAALVRRNMEINWSMAPIVVHEAAVADKFGEVTLYVPRGHGANASLSAPDEFECETITVPLLRLDDTIPPNLTVDIMKIDVEGHEAAVLRGARDVIARSPNLHLVMEWSRKQMKQAGIDPTDIVGMLDGFTPHRIEVDSEPLAHPESIEWLLTQDYTDALFVRI
jgi:FkbM family methyltransferase